MHGQNGDSAVKDFDAVFGGVKGDGASAALVNAEAKGGQGSCCIFSVVYRV